MTTQLIQSADLRQCAQLFCRIFSNTPWNESWSEDNSYKRLKHFYESAGFVGTSIKQDAIAGFALGNIEPFESRHIYYLREFCIAPETQSRGLGRAVYQALEQQLLALDVQSIYLATRNEIPAVHFYANLGFNKSPAMGFYVKNLAQR